MVFGVQSDQGNVKPRSTVISVPTALSKHVQLPRALRTQARIQRLSRHRHYHQHRQCARLVGPPYFGSAVCDDSWATGICRYGDLRQREKEGGVVRVHHHNMIHLFHIHSNSRWTTHEAPDRDREEWRVPKKQALLEVSISFAVHPGTHDAFGRCGSDTRTGHSLFPS